MASVFCLSVFVYRPLLSIRSKQSIKILISSSTLSIVRVAHFDHPFVCYFIHIFSVFFCVISNNWHRCYHAIAFCLLSLFFYFTFSLLVKKVVNRVLFFFFWSFTIEIFFWWKIVK